MKKNLIISCCIILILSLIMISNFDMLTGVYNGDDTKFHLLRIFGIMESNHTHYINFLYLNNFGYAQPLFYTDLMIYPVVKVSTVFTDNVLLIYNFIIIFYSIITFLLCSFVYYKIRSKILEAQVFAIIYTFNIYRLNDIYKRGALSELVALTFIPLFIYSIYLIYNDLKNNEKKFTSSYICFILTLVLIVYSHALSSIMIFYIYVFVILIFIIIFRKNAIYFIKNLFFSSLIILLLSSIYLLPLIEQIINNSFYFQLDDRTLCYQGYQMNIFFDAGFFTNIRYNIITFFPFLIGLIVIVKNYMYNKSNKFYNTIYSSYIVCLLYLFVIPICGIPLLKSIQFPWRFLGLINGLGIFILIFSMEFFTNTKMKKFYLSIIVAISIMIIPLEFHKYNIALEELDFMTSITVKEVTGSIGRGEYLPADFDINYASNFVEDGSQTTYEDNVYTIEILDADKTEYELPIIYYKGYETNNEKVKIEQSSKGLINVNIEGNINEFTITYKRTFIQYMAIALTCLGILILGYLIFKSGKRK